MSYLSLYFPVTKYSPYLHLLKLQEMFSDIHSHSETVVSYHIYKEEDIAALKKALRYRQILPTVSFLMVLLCSHDLDILYEMLEF